MNRLAKKLFLRSEIYSFLYYSVLRIHSKVLWGIQSHRLFQYDWVYVPTFLLFSRAHLLMFECIWFSIEFFCQHYQKHLLQQKYNHIHYYLRVFKQTCLKNLKTRCHQYVYLMPCWFCNCFSVTYCKSHHSKSHLIPSSSSLTNW